ncbi:hypothetical protein G5I_08502 [Acromyrmex echinatior]|uniref:Ionotropic receptor 75a N-terminal domain-containing protein n=1 Tax=Acromyrmex echinatior TaxID=103372 RepID=F4WRP9_ACREC|nr:hypothetical protein G5I_08502 [Acromyrmex echinatior]
MRHGSWKLLFLSRLLLVSYANDNIMARDYFLYKDVSNVVGFSCGGLESNVKFARTFNEVFVLTSMCNLASVNGSSLRILRKLLQNNYRNLGIYVDARCEDHNYTVIYYEATKSFLFDETHKWLILGRKLDDTLSLLNDDSFGVVTDITIAIETDTGFDLYDVYNPCKARGGSLNVTVLGYWTEKSGVVIRLKQSKYERRFNLHGMKLRVGVLLPRKFYNLSMEAIVLNQDMKAKYGRSQFLYTILLHMADLFNFTMEIVEVDPRKRQDNSAPMFVAFQKKTVDISASPIVMKADRLRSGDIIGPVWPMRVLILNYYSASIVSDRLKNMGVKMNDSLISLADSQLKVAAEPTAYIRSFLQTPEKEIRYFNAKRWDKLPESKRYLPLAEGLNRVTKGGLAYHTSIESAYPYIERHFHPRMICELTEVHLFRAVLALWGRHRSPFTPLFRIGLTKMYDVGIRRRQLKFWSARKPFCPKNMLIAEPLSIYEAVPVFVFIGIAAALSLVICIIENLVYWLWPRLLISTTNGQRKLCFPKFMRNAPTSPSEIFSRE